LNQLPAKYDTSAIAASAAAVRTGVREPEVALFGTAPAEPLRLPTGTPQR
jgi:hypothetical protein